MAADSQITPTTPTGPASADGYEPPRWLRSGHVNTIYSYLRPRRVALPPSEDALIEAAPGVRLLLRCNWQRQAAPCLLLLHGLEGNSEVGYMRTVAAKAWRRGWHAIRMNVRGCGASEPHSATLYNSGLSGDLARAAGWARTQPRVEQLALCGFSMGGNTVLKYAGELGAGQWPANGGGVPAAAVVAISACLDLGPSADALHRRPCWLYERRFLRQLRRRVQRWQARAAFTTTEPSPGVWRPDWRLSRAAFRSIRAFDDLVIAPLFGYRGADDYYWRASAARVLDRVRTPALIVHAEDDPFIVITAASRAVIAANPALRFVAARHGGHCAFMQPRPAAGEDVYWAENRALDFCAAQFAVARSGAGSEGPFMGRYKV